MTDERADDSGSLTTTIELTAQQANLARAVLTPQPDALNAPARDTSTGTKIVDGLTPEEFKNFRSTWKRTPIASIGVMNRAIGDIVEPQRAARYLWAAFELELLMDRRRSPLAPDEELTGIPEYLMDGYTDMGANSPKGRRRSRERILVDKEKLRPQLLQTKRQVIEVFSKTPAPAVVFESLLRTTAQSLREDVRYEEIRDVKAVMETTVLLSDCVEIVLWTAVTSRFCTSFECKKQGSTLDWSKASYDYSVPRQDMSGTSRRVTTHSLSWM